MASSGMFRGLFIGPFPIGLLTIDGAMGAFATQDGTFWVVRNEIERAGRRL
jgi:hypothetical protein